MNRPREPRRSFRSYGGRQWTVVFGFLALGNVLIFISSRGIGQNPARKPAEGPSMWMKAIDHCADLSMPRVIWFGVLLAVAIEAFTLWMRFGLGLQSTRDTGFVGAFTFGIRIHHGYLGILLGLLAWALFRGNIGLKHACYMVAMALFLSDLVHHFVILWPLVGSPEFHLTYPQPKS